MERSSTRGGSTPGSTFPVHEATEIRETGKKENALAIKDAKQAQDSLTNAIAVLEAFYTAALTLSTILTWT